MTDGRLALSTSLSHITLSQGADLQVELPFDISEIRSCLQ